MPPSCSAGSGDTSVWRAEYPAANRPRRVGLRCKGQRHPARIQRFRNGMKTMVASTTRSRLRECLNDVDFPADKDSLVRAAVRNCCDDDTGRALRAIPPETYANFSELLASVPLSDERLSDAEKGVARHGHTKRGLAGSAKDIPPPSPIVEEPGENRKA